MAGYFFYSKQKNLKPVTAKDSLDARTKSFENKMSGSNNPA
jgi:hypothetical protein